MDHSKQIGEFANDVSNGNTEDAERGIGVNEIRTLNDLETVLAGGGDGIVIW